MSMLDSSQPRVTPALGNPVPSVDFCQHPHTYDTHSRRYTHTKNTVRASAWGSSMMPSIWFTDTQEKPGVALCNCTQYCGDWKTEGLIGCQPSFSERSCLQGIRRRTVERDTQHPPHNHTWEHTYTEKRNLILSDFIQQLPGIGFLGPTWGQKESMFPRRE